nr:MAG TPA: hypothetical protein [Caudoviricetes sp.]
MVGGFFNIPMGLTKVLSGEIEPHPCHSPHGERFPFLPVFGRNPVFRLGTMLTKASCFCDIFQFLQNCKKTVAKRSLRCCIR